MAAVVGDDYSGGIGTFGTGDETVAPSGVSGSAGRQISNALRVRKESKMRAKLTLRQQLWMLMDDPQSGPWAAGFAKTILVLILLSSLSFVMSTEQTTKDSESAMMILGGIEYVSITIFTLEVTLRTLTTPDYSAYWADPYTWIDLLAIVPFYVELAFSSDTKWLAVVRVLRLVRVARIFKMSRYSTSIRVFMVSLAQSSKALTMLLALVMLACVIFSSAMYYAEYTRVNRNTCRKWREGTVSDWETDECQEENPFRSIPAGFWWCLVTMTTVGYGDAVPATAFGKLIAVVTAVSGVIVIALPITVIGTNFARVLREMIREQIMDHISMMDEDQDGEVTEQELRIMLDRFRDLGLFVSVDNEHVARELMKKYDTDGDGVLNEEEVLALQSDLETRAIDMLTANNDMYRLDTDNRASNKKIDKFGRLLHAKLGIMERKLMVDMKTTMDGLVELNNIYSRRGGQSALKKPVTDGDDGSDGSGGGGFGSPPPPVSPTRRHNV